MSRQYPILAQICTDSPKFEQICSNSHRFIQTSTDLHKHAQINRNLHKLAHILTNWCIFVQSRNQEKKLENDLSNTKVALRKQSSVNKDVAKHTVTVQISVAGQDEVELTESQFVS